MNMEKADGGVDYEARWKMLTDTLLKVDDILAYNIINQNNRLVGMKIRVF